MHQLTNSSSMLMVVCEMTFSLLRRIIAECDLKTCSYHTHTCTHTWEYYGRFGSNLTLSSTKLCFIHLCNELLAMKIQRPQLNFRALQYIEMKRTNSTKSLLHPYVTKNLFQMQQVGGEHFDSEKIKSALVKRLAST